LRPSSDPNQRSLEGARSVFFIVFYFLQAKGPEREVSVTSLKELFSEAVSNQGGTMLGQDEPVPEGKLAYAFQVNGENFGTVVLDNPLQAAMIADHVKDNRPKGTDMSLDFELVQR